LCTTNININVVAGVPRPAIIPLILQESNQPGPAIDITYSWLRRWPSAVSRPEDCSAGASDGIAAAGMETSGGKHSSCRSQVLRIVAAVAAAVGMLDASWFQWS
jgi:hypothetical protein